MGLTEKQGKSLGFDRDEVGNWMLNPAKINPVLLAELMLGRDCDDDDDDESAI